MRKRKIFFLWMTYVGIVLFFAGLIGKMNGIFLWMTEVGGVLFLAGLTGVLLTFGGE